VTALTVAAIQAMVAVCNPPPDVTWQRVAAHARIESGFVPSAIHDNDTNRSYFPGTIADAIALARQLRAQGHSIDGGPLQINSNNWNRLHLPLERVFDPQSNVCAATIILAGDYDTERRVSCRYNTGKPNCNNGYAERIARMQDELARGQWGTSASPPTPVSRAMTVIQMSDRELTRLRVMIDLADGRLTPAAAGTLMGIGRRQVFRLRRAFEASGASGLTSQKRGRASNRKHGEAFRRTVLSLVGERYPDFGPTFAVEKLVERHGLRVGVETLRQWMMADGLWIDRRHRLPSPHQPRRRRECLGELVQIDGSEHAWFEDRGETCTLLAFVDDATSRLMQLRFVASESAFHAGR
jgi:Helix-turn-helix domain/Transglycosylase SLT domain